MYQRVKDQRKDNKRGFLYREYEYRRTGLLKWDITKSPP